MLRRTQCARRLPISARRTLVKSFQNSLVRQSLSFRSTMRQPVLGEQTRESALFVMNGSSTVVSCGSSKKPFAYLCMGSVPSHRAARKMSITNWGSVSCTSLGTAMAGLHGGRKWEHAMQQCKHAAGHEHTLTVATRERRNVGGCDTNAFSDVKVVLRS
ncbi:hypothetical protein OBBRIDRAFT_367893 [Obba rivulosa]|uniref:Uncharacterized protein n=1 Tax=Obba rivulosa TaxID=1052685 RepID=A0A8E2DV06_9APHY|nr:hypothetical protein OBBRIDRAFT_367893 [Obba rivulosa]